jgi:hypothetical protein
MVSSKIKNVSHHGFRRLLEKWQIPIELRYIPLDAKV